MLISYVSGGVRVVRDDVICCCRFSINTKDQIISLVNGNIEEIVLLLFSVSIVNDNVEVALLKRFKMYGLPYKLLKCHRHNGNIQVHCVELIYLKVLYFLGIADIFLKILMMWGCPFPNQFFV